MDDLKARPDWQEIKGKIYKDNKDLIDLITDRELDDYPTRYWDGIGGDQARIEKIYI